MLESLKFVQGAVAKKDLLPEMTHFRIRNGTVKAYNGKMAICSPIEFDIDCMPKADMLVSAIQQCDETVSLSMTPAKRLKITSGSFKAFVECVDSDIADVVPEGQIINVDGKILLKAFSTIQPFIGDDASRPWSNGILLRGQSAFATNNVCLVEYWLGVTFPREVNIPRSAIREVLRVAQAPEHIQLTDNSITFYYGENKWIRSQLYTPDWPELSPILDRESVQKPIDNNLFKAVESISRFVNKMGAIYMRDGAIHTEAADNLGASYAFGEPHHLGCYNHRMLMLLEGIAETVDWTAYPNPVLFFGERLRGAIIGMAM